MVELLVATIMSFLIITPILAFAVNILESDVREQAKASTELELQSAMDYIQQDISQAYYIYDGAGVKEVQDQLYYKDDLVNKIPVLVFWKRELAKNAIDVTATPAPILCDKPIEDDDDPNLQNCDDTYVDSLVAYYLVKDDLAKWCQPGTVNCPARIERWSIRDGAKNSDGTYLCGVEGKDATCDADDKKTFKRSLGIPYIKADKTPDGTPFDIIKPNEWVKSSEDYNTTPQVLVNYIAKGDVTPITDQCSNVLNVTTPAENDLRIGVTDYANPDTFKSFYGCVNSADTIAQITIKGDAMRRNEAKNADCDPAKKSPYCPSVSGQIRGMSGFGQ